LCNNGFIGVKPPIAVVEGRVRNVWEGVGSAWNKIKGKKKQKYRK